MSTLSELFPAGGGDNSIDMVATGTLPNGSPVILKADGTVEVVGSTGVAESIPAGSSTSLPTGTTSYISASFDPNTTNQFVVTYVISGNGSAVVGTISGTSITFGTAYVFSSGTTLYPTVAFNPNTANQFVIAWQNYTSSYSAVCTISGTSITVGSTYPFTPEKPEYINIVFDANTPNKFVIAFHEVAGGESGKATVGTISGTSISYGALYQFNTGYTRYCSASIDPNNAGQFIITYQDYNNGRKGTAVVGTVSGTTISYGSDYIFHSGGYGGVYLTDVDVDPASTGKFVVSYTNNDNEWGYVVAGSISGNSLTFGTAIQFTGGANTRYLTAHFVPGLPNNFILSYSDMSLSGDSTVELGTISGTSITINSSHSFGGPYDNWQFVATDIINTGRFVEINSGGTATLGQVSTLSTNLTSTNLLGISQKAVANGETTSVETLGGLSAVHSGLTIGSDYYVATDGSLTTTSTGNVSIGKATSATTLNMRDYV